MSKSSRKRLKHQYLFDSKKFYELKDHQNFPSALCFPDFFAYSTATILNWYEYILRIQHCNYIEINNDILLLCFNYFQSLQTIIDSIFGITGNGSGGNSGVSAADIRTISLISPEEIHEKIISFVLETKRKKIANKSHQFNKATSIFLLETFLRDQLSVFNYRQCLYRRSLEFCGVGSLSELVNHLRNSDVCPAAHDELCCDCFLESSSRLPVTPPPSSTHYIRHFCHCTPFPDDAAIFGPRLWGPIYWNVFHFLADNASDDCENDRDDYGGAGIVRVLNKFVQFLPLIIPCPDCRLHYCISVRPSRLRYVRDVKELRLLFNAIHGTVSSNVAAAQNVERVGAGFVRNAHHS